MRRWCKLCLVFTVQCCCQSFLVAALVFRPPDIHVYTSAGRFYRDSIFYLTSATLQARWTELGSKPATCSEVSAIWKCMSEIWGIPSPKKSKAPKPPFGRLRNLTATLTAYIFRTKQDICKVGQVRWKLQGVSYIVSKCHEHRSTNCLKSDRSFYPPSIVRLCAL